MPSAWRVFPSILLGALACAAGAASPACGGDEPAPAPPPPPVAAPDPNAPRPRIVLDRTSHDFGAVRQHADAATEFTVTNAGTAPLFVASLKGDCGCAAATIDASTVAPGGKATISVVFRTHTFVGRQRKTIRVASNDPDAKQLDLVLTLDVSAGILLEPAYFAFTPVLVGTVPTASLRAQWKDGAGKKFAIRRVECPELPDAVFETTPFDAPPWHGYDVQLTFKKPPPLGPVLGRAVMKTDDPDTPSLVADVSGSVSGRVVLSQRVVTFGHVKAGVGGRREVVCRGFDSDVKLGEVTTTTSNGIVVASVRRDEKDPARYLIEIRLPESTLPGTLVDFVQVHTQVAGEEVLAIKVVGAVLPADK